MGNTDCFFFTRVTLEQCIDDDGPCVEPHVVTSVNSLTVDVADGTELVFIVWQDRDPVIRHQFSLRPDDKSKESGKKKRGLKLTMFVFWSTSIQCTMYLQLLVIWEQFFSRARRSVSLFRSMSVQ